MRSKQLVLKCFLSYLTSNVIESIEDSRLRKTCQCSCAVNFLSAPVHCQSNTSHINPCSFMSIIILSASIFSPSTLSTLSQSDRSKFILNDGNVSDKTESSILLSVFFWTFVLKTSTIWIRIRFMYLGFRSIPSFRTVAPGFPVSFPNSSMML